MQLEIHKNIKDKLEYFYNIKKIPNIIFNGPSGAGKSTIVNEFMNLIYGGNKDIINDFVMYVNCAHGKGIKFIRDELKFFAKMHINSNGGDIFKSIILLNGDKLTVDAQSALRRCIELFSHNTRFFIVVEDKYKLLKPILSRFCEIYVPIPEYKGKQLNLYKYGLEQTYKFGDIKVAKMDWLKKELVKMKTELTNVNKVVDIVVKLYEKGYSALDLIQLIENDASFLEKEKGEKGKEIEEKKYELLITFTKVKKEFRNEKMLMFFILNFVYLDNQYSLENICFM